MAKKGLPIAAALREVPGRTARGKLPLVVAALCCLAWAVPALAAAPVAAQALAAEKRSLPGKLTLYAKDPVTWKLLPGGTAGTLSYKEPSGEFSFFAARLAPLTGYALIRYGDHPAKADLLAEGKSDREGALHLTGVWKQWTKKIWLVLRADLARSGSQVAATAWHPERYLFEEKELGVPCQCEENP